MAFLKIRGLAKNFSGLTAIDNLDWEVEQGTINGVIGPNGAGKTTLFNMINGFIHPNRGVLDFNDITLIGLRPDQIAREGISTVFQHSKLFRSKTVIESMLVGCLREQRTGFWQAFFNTTSYRDEERAIYQRAFEILQLMRIDEYKDSLVETLPFGAQRLLAIGQAVMTKPKLLLMDEPFTGLNEGELRDLMEAVKIIRNQGTTILLIEHNIEGVVSICERIMVLNHGKKIADGTPKEVTNDQIVIESYLGSKRNVT